MSNPFIQDVLTPEQRIRLEAVNQVTPFFPMLTQINNGDAARAQAQLLKLAKKVETFVSTGSIIITDGKE